MTREEDIKKVVEQWKIHIPPEVEILTVWKVVEEYFPESVVKKKRGSHLYYVHWEQSKDLARLYDLTKIDPFEADGRFLLPVSGGRFVKKVYINKLIKAIEYKEKYDEIR